MPIPKNGFSSSFWRASRNTPNSIFHPHLAPPVSSLVPSSTSGGRRKRERERIVIGRQRNRQFWHLYFSHNLDLKTLSSHPDAFVCQSGRDPKLTTFGLEDASRSSVSASLQLTQIAPFPVVGPASRTHRLVGRSVGRSVYPTSIPRPHPRPVVGQPCCHCGGLGREQPPLRPTKPAPGPTQVEVRERKMKRKRKMRPD
ncbi:unnamed protein product [Protopolystoma xenopodis]|uniref:Uncharacterized protein n=1 Tax=Protopolystoma xenopodis TaxID=117903 RepID=A0A3S5FDQ3_9PLAT|nr:unnamed protein product [Protopolystoma xenopodis]